MGWVGPLIQRGIVAMSLRELPASIDVMSDHLPELSGTATSSKASTRCNILVMITY